MAETPTSELHFTGGCGDCGERRVELPAPLPGVPDDFDWTARDYDSFRLFLMEELAARAPERSRWTAADLEVVIVEVLAAALDRLSHALDTIQQERFVETARRPESLRRLLALIGYDPLDDTDPDKLAGLPPAPVGFGPESDNEKLERLWKLQPREMERARLAGPAAIRTQKRMVTLADYGITLEAHPLVARAQARSLWSGSWQTIRVAVLPARQLGLEAAIAGLPAGLLAEVAAFHRARGIAAPPETPETTVRDALAILVEAYRMAGQPVLLEAAETLGITFSLSVQVRDTFYRSEVLNALRAAYGTDAEGFFAPGRLRFGEDLYASDLIEVAYAVEGVETVCLNRFKRVGSRYPDRADAGFIPVAPDEIATCRNDPTAPQDGYFRIATHGGIPG